MMNRTDFRNARGDAGRAKWGQGPWQKEPDKVTWIDEATMLDCMAVRNHWGSWCGYAGVPPGHPAHGAHYDDPVVAHVRVHGGLTFCGGCDESEDPAVGICHVPLPGRPNDIYWFGFDCGHAWDLQPEMALMHRERYKEAKAAGDRRAMALWDFRAGRDEDDPFLEVYRTLAYVIAESNQLAAQLHRGRPQVDLTRLEHLEMPDGESR
jgi:hypothetical protein